MALIIAENIYMSEKKSMQFENKVIGTCRLEYNKPNII